MDNIVKLRNILQQITNNDYGIEIYSYTENSIVLSFYHLNNVYNALCYINIKDDKYNYIDWQYAPKNKKIENLIIRLGNTIKALQFSNNNFDFLINEFAHFKELANNIYNSKYSIELDLYNNKVR